MRFVLSILVLSLIPAVAAAQLGPIPGEERFAGIAGDEQNTAGAGLGYAKISEDHFLQLTIRTGLNLGKIGIGFQIPLNLRVIDNDPENNDDYGGIIRKEDWDEPSEYLKIIRYVRYGHKHSRDLLFVRVGELAASIGHGTIMDRYMNNIDVNTFRVGSQLDVYTNYGGIETVVSDYGSLLGGTAASKIVGGRAYIKPYGLVDPEGALNIFKVGVSVVTDVNAPREIAMEPAEKDGTPLYKLPNEDACDPAGGDPDCQPYDVPVIDGKGNLEVAKDGSFTVWGLDAEVEAVNTSVIKITPYTDLNFMQDAGWGWHLGTLVTLRMPIGFELTVPIRLEYRRFKSNYKPAYFSTAYEVERFAYRDPEQGNAMVGPKGEFFKNKPGGEGLDGVYADLALDFANIFQIGAIYEGYKGAPPNLAAFLAVPALQVVQFKAYYTKTGVDDLDDFFTLDNRSLLIAQARYQVITFVYLVGRYTRRWVLDSEDPTSKTYGTFQSTDDYQVGIEASFAF